MPAFTVKRIRNVKSNTVRESREIIGLIFTTRFTGLACVCLLLNLGGCSDNESEPSTSSQADTFRSAIQVKTVVAASGELSSQMEVNGTVSAFRKATLAAELSARVQARLVEPGQRVKEDDVLLKLDTETTHNRYLEAQAMLAARKVELESANNELQRGRELIEKKFISQDRLEDLEFAQRAASAQRDAASASFAVARKQLSDSNLKAPFTGTIEDVMVQQGDYLNPGQAVATLADFSKLRIRAGISARQSSLFHKGQAVGVSFAALGIAEAGAEVASIGRIANSSTGNYPMEIWLEGESFSQVREGMVATIRATMSSGQDVVQIPSRAIVRRDGQAVVFVVSDGRAELRPVRSGRSTIERIEIVEGLQAGEIVVVDGQFALRDGALIEVMQ